MTRASVTRHWGLGTSSYGHGPRHPSLSVSVDVTGKGPTEPSRRLRQRRSDHAQGTVVPGGSGEVGSVRGLSSSSIKVEPRRTLSHQPLDIQRVMRRCGQGEFTVDFWGGDWNLLHPRYNVDRKNTETVKLTSETTVHIPVND